MNDLNDKSSEGLAAIVVAYRVFGVCKDEARQAMSELLRRKEIHNDNFEYEQFISSELEKLPKPNVPNDVIKLMKTLSSTGLK